MLSETALGAEKRLSAIEPVLEALEFKTEQLQAQLKAQSELDTGDMPTAAIDVTTIHLAEEGGVLSTQHVERIRLANDVAEVSLNNNDLVQIANDDGEIKPVSDFARRYGEETVNGIPDAIAADISQKLCEAQSEAIVEGVISADRVVLADISVKDGVVSALRDSNALAAPMNEVQLSYSPPSNILESGENVRHEAVKIDTQRVAAKLGLKPVDFDALFGNNDESITEERDTIYGPASYLVDLLLFLEKPAIELAGTENPLDYLLRRRPDLRHLPLTPENTDEVLPYGDVVNEIMESFISNLGDYAPEHVENPKQSDIIAYNVEHPSASDLLRRPQNPKIDAHAYLADAVYPLSLPYNQSIDTARKYLQFLQIDRADLIDKYRSRPPRVPHEKAEIVRKLHKEKLDRLYDAESLDMTEEEYTLLTKQGFQSPEYFRVMHDLNDEQIRLQYGIRPVHEHYGYKTWNDLQAYDGTGLEAVKGQFLRRTGISWQDLALIVQTRFVNPHKPEGKDGNILKVLPFTYRYLQTLVIPDDTTADPYKHIRKAITDGLRSKSRAGLEAVDLDDWVNNKFAKMGQLIVLDHNNGMFLRIRKNQTEAEDLQVVGKSPVSKPFTGIMTLSGYGKLVNDKGTPIGSVTKEGQLMLFGVNSGGVLIKKRFPDQDIELQKIVNGQPVVVATVRSEDSKIVLTDKASNLAGQVISYMPSSSSDGISDIEAVTISHLDGTSLELEEWDRIQLFVRLWKKLKWSIEEVDTALAVVSLGDDQSDPGVEPQDPDISKARISPRALRQLVIIKKISQLTGFSLEETLILWTNLTTSGRNSFYARMFLQRLMPGTEDIFRADRNGRYMYNAVEGSLSQNAFSVVASLGIRVADLNTAIAKQAISDHLSLENVSMLYRFMKISRFLGINISDLFDLIRIYGKPLATPGTTLSFLEEWRTLQNFGFTVEEVDYITESDHNNTRNALATNDVKIAVIFKPYLAKQLSQESVVNMIASIVDSSDLNLISSLLSLINTPGVGGLATPETAMDKLIRVGSLIGDSRDGGGNISYLLVPLTDDYVFYFDAVPEGFHINDESYSITGEDGTYSTGTKRAIRLNADQLYRVSIHGMSIHKVQWKVAGSPRQLLPDTAILPNISSYGLGPLFDRFQRAYIVAKRFGLTSEEVVYIDNRRQDFGGIDFNALKIHDLQRLGSFVTFRDSLPTSGVTPLRNLFNWCEESSLAKQGQKDRSTTPKPNTLSSADLQVTDANLLRKKIAEATGWNTDSIDLVFQEADFPTDDLDIFATEKYLVKMGQMIKFAKRADVDIPSLFRWAQPIDCEIVKESSPKSSKTGPRKMAQFEKQFTEYHRIAMEIRLAAQSRRSPALKFVNDTLRENQRDAMINYLVNLDELQQHGIQDADSLFDFFLVDGQTAPLVETTRIQQAILTVQLFVQRCFLGLESDFIPPDALDSNRWELIKEYSTWVANRKIKR
jgi:hypothetical protein